MSSKNFSTIKEQIDEWIRLDYICPEDIPSIELYMDQVTTFMDKHLKGNKRHEDDKILTKTMINNYSKNDLLPPSDKKKYSKNHIILLIYIYYMKNFLSISDIEQLLNPMTNAYFDSTDTITMEDIYQSIFSLEQTYGIKVKENIHEIYDIANTQFDDEHDYLKTFSMIAMLSYDIYSKKQLIERLLDSMYPAPTGKNEKKEAKQTAKQTKRKK